MHGKRIKPLAQLFVCAVLPLFCAGCFSCSGSGGWERVMNPLCREGYLPSGASMTAPERTTEIPEEEQAHHRMNLR